MLRTTLKKLIYPRGKVHKNYGKYVGWSCFSNFIISIESVLSTHSMLSVVGQASTELTLSVNYIGKDIVGQIGGLYYMNKMGEKADKEPKKFVKYSMAFQQASVFMECTTPMLPISTFIPVATLAEDNNVGEIYAKISVLNTLGSTIGMGLGLVIAAHIPDHTTRLGLMPILTMIRIYSYNKAIEDLI